MAIETFPLGPLQTNSYLVHADGMAVAVDVGGDPAPMLDFAAGKGLRITDIILTHLHFDHVYGVAALARSHRGRRPYPGAGSLSCWIRNPARAASGVFRPSRPMKARTLPAAIIRWPA